MLNTRTVCGLPSHHTCEHRTHGRTQTSILSCWMLLQDTCIQTFKHLCCPDSILRCIEETLRRKKNRSCSVLTVEKKKEWAELNAATLWRIWWLSLSYSGNCHKCPPTSLHPSDTSTAAFPTTIPLKGEATTCQQWRKHLHEHDFYYSYTCKRTGREWRDFLCTANSRSSLQTYKACSENVLWG